MGGRVGGREEGKSLLLTEVRRHFSQIKTISKKSIKSERLILNG